MCSFERADRFDSPEEIIHLIKNIPIKRVEQQVLTDRKIVVIGSKERSIPKWKFLMSIILILSAITYLIFR